MRTTRTDLAMESAQEHGSLPGVSISGWDTGDIHVTEVLIEAGEGARLLGKAPGAYITIEGTLAQIRDVAGRGAMGNVLGEEIARLLPPKDDRPVLVLGLGNRMVTPDALGPKTVEMTLVTRHIFQELPDTLDERVDAVAAIAPGVLGVTGIETVEMAQGIVAQLKPRAIVCIDALAARAVSRIGATAQLTNTGIQPGSGVGNHRRALNRETLGAPVLALGVPMVIDAASIARDAMEMLDEKKHTSPEQFDTLERALNDSPLGGMIVTPREVDDLLGDVSRMLACGINRALHPDLSEQEILGMMA